MFCWYEGWLMSFWPLITWILITFWVFITWCFFLLGVLIDCMIALWVNERWWVFTGLWCSVMLSNKSYIKHIFINTKMQIFTLLFIIYSSNNSKKVKPAHFIKYSTAALRPGSRRMLHPSPPTSTQWWRAARSWTRRWRSVTALWGSSPSCFHTDQITARPAMWVKTPSRGQRCPNWHCSPMNFIQSSQLSNRQGAGVSVLWWSMKQQRFSTFTQVSSFIIWILCF